MYLFTEKLPSQSALMAVAAGLTSSLFYVMERLSARRFVFDTGAEVVCFLLVENAVATSLDPVLKQPTEAILKRMVHSLLN